MIVKKLPNIIGYPAPIQYLTPSQFTKVTDGCFYACLLEKALREAAPKDDKTKFNMPPSPNSIHGTIVHQLLKKRVDGAIASEEDFEQEWEKAIEKQRSLLQLEYPGVDYSELDDYGKMYHYEELILRIEPLCNSSNYINDYANCILSPSTTTEVCMSIKDCLLGYIDRIRKNNGNIQIIDYKTGDVLDDKGEVKQIYKDQLNLYGLLYQYNNNENVDKLLIIDSSGKEYEVAKSDKISLDYVDHIKQFVSNINNHITNGTIEQLAVPGIAGCNCKMCNVRHICSKNQFEITGNFGHIKFGKVTDASDRNRNSISVLLQNGSTIKIIELARLNILGFNNLLGKTLLFTNLIKYDNRINTFKFSDKSQVFEQDEKNNYGCIDNFLPELSELLKWIIDNNKSFDKKGNYSILDEDGDVVAEAGIGWKDKKIVAIPLDSISERYFIKKGYRVFGEKELETIKQFL